MTIICADLVLAAREHLDNYGLCRDGTWGSPDGPCCTIGNVAAAWRDPDVSSDEDLDTEGDFVASHVAAAWKRWMAAEQDCPIAAEGDQLTERLIEWNDDGASIAQVARFYDWWAADLTAAGMGDATDAR